MLLATDQN